MRVEGGIMKQSIFARQNARVITMLVIMLCVFLVNGIVQWNAVRLMYDEIIVYENAVRQVKDVRFLCQKQGEVWKEIALDPDRAGRYREYFYDMSGLSDRIQDALHNLKILFADDRFLSDSLDTTIDLHKNLSRESVSRIFELDRTDVRQAGTFILTMEEEYTATRNSIDKLVMSIDTRAGHRTDEIRKSYGMIILGSTIAGLCLFIALTVMILMSSGRTQREIMDLSRTLNSYLPHQLVLSVLKRGKSAIPELARKNITVCFTDLEGFTAASEGCEPEVIARILNEYLTEMAVIAQSWGGMVDKFMGDGIMIVFGAFEDDVDTHSLHCVKMAVAMQMRMNELLVKWRDDGFEARLGLRIGINAGFATVGSIGPENRRSFTAVGSVVNIASRLEKLCVTGKILIGYDVHSKVCADVVCRLCADRTIKGISRSIRVYEVES
jgi:class 3 adenylate cyclase